MTDTATDQHDANKALIARLRAAQYDWTAEGVQAVISELFVADAQVRLAFPFEDLDGGQGWYDEALAPLASAWPDIERRDVFLFLDT